MSNVELIFEQISSFKEFANICNGTCPFRLSCNTLNMAIARRHSWCFRSILEYLERLLDPENIYEKLNAHISAKMMDQNANIFCLTPYKCSGRSYMHMHILFYITMERATDDKIEFQQEIIKMVKFLAFNGIDINREEEGETLLHRSVHLEQYFLVKALIEMNADPHLKNRYGKTPKEVLLELPKVYYSKTLQEREEIKELLEYHEDMYLYYVKNPDE